MGLGSGLALALFVARVRADDAQDVLAFHDAAGFAKALDGGSYFHGFLSGFKGGLEKNRRDDGRTKDRTGARSLRASAI